VNIVIKDRQNSVTNIKAFDQVITFAQSRACTGWKASTEHTAIVTKWAGVYITAPNRIELPCGCEVINITDRSLQAPAVVGERKKTHPTVTSTKVAHICMVLGRYE
jgi:hypothetical protein